MTQTDIKNRLRELEKEIAIYYKELNSPTLPTQESGIVFFKYLYEMATYSTLLSFVDDYTPSNSTEVLVARELENIKKYITTKDDKVVISQDYLDLIKPYLNKIQ